jgi:regulator of sigma E protease
VQEFFGSIWWLVVSLGVLVTFHEFGHYWVARRCGVKVLRFSVGFGKALWKRTAKDGTEYVIAAIPLGGYVKMLDEREDHVAPELAAQAFNRKSVAQRFAIVAAGPLFNLILCVALLWAMFLIGKTDFAPVVGEVTGIAAESGLRPNDRILTLDGEPVPTWTDVLSDTLIAAIDRRPVQLTVQREGSSEPQAVTLDLSRLPADFDQSRAFAAMGLAPRHWKPEPVAGEVSEDGPAARAGLRAGDRILAIGPTAIGDFGAIAEAVKAQAHAGEPLPVRVLRADGGEETLAIVPEWSERGAKRARWILGISDASARAVLRYGPLDAVGAALRETAALTDRTVTLLLQMVTGRASLENISGPITIAQVANTTAGIGPDWFLSFLAMLSLSLCIMNLLPVPILDGGHLLYFLVEMLKGSPVSERVMVAGQYVGLGLLAGLMGLAFYNDIARLVSS